MHLLIDGAEGSRDLLDSQRVVSQLLFDIPAAIDMQIIVNPTVAVWSDPAKPDDRGWSGFCMVAESHVSIHTFPERGIVWVDVFSCKGFPDAPVIALIETAFDLGRYQSVIVDRGLDVRGLSVRGAGEGVRARDRLLST